jgi:DNA-binding PadR family transcriptional regulator
MTDLEALLLGVLRDEGRCHGLDVGKLAADRANRVLGAGSLYRTLHRLEQQALVIAEWEDPDVDLPHQGPPRRYYRIAAHGARALSTHVKELEARSVMLRPRSATT